MSAYVGGRMPNKYNELVFNPARKSLFGVMNILPNKCQKHKANKKHKYNMKQKMKMIKVTLYGKIQNIESSI
jgi:hypothetical protein